MTDIRVVLLILAVINAVVWWVRKPYHEDS